MTLRLVLIITLFFTSFSSYCQSTEINGYILEGETKIPISYAKIYFLGTQIGAYSDTNGYFRIESNTKNLFSDSILITCLGYDSKIILIQKDSIQKIEVALFSNLFSELDEIVVHPGENPAWKYLRQIINAKDKNNPDQLSYYSYDEYSKVRFDLNHFTDKIKKNILFRPFDYIWENAQITEDGVNYLPALLTEQLSEHNYRKNPLDKKDIIISEKRTGLEGPNLINFTNDLYMNPNIYDNYMMILGKSFPSPLNDNYKSNYLFYLQDSTTTLDGKEYKISFVPKYKRQIAFTGEIFIDSATNAITEYTLRFDVMANVNFIRSYYITQIFKKIENTYWMPEETKVVGDFTVLENASDLTGFFGRKQSIYSNYSINDTISNTQFKGVEKWIYADSSLIRSENYWENNRKLKLSEEENQLKLISQRVIDDPAFKIRKNIIQTIGTGFIPFKPFQVGIYSMFNYNNIENLRLKLNLRTNPKQKFPIHTDSYLAYGFSDKIWKYKIDINSRLNRLNTLRIGSSYSYDIQQIGRSFYQLPIDHTIGSITQIGRTNSKNYVRNFEIYLEKEIVTGCLFRLSYFNQLFQPTTGNKYQEINDLNGDTLTLKSLNSSGFRGTFKFSYLYKKLTGNFYDRKDLYSEPRPYPDIALSFDVANKNLLGSQFDYNKIKISIRQKVNFKKLGFLNYNIELGKTFGDVPFVFLDIPFGNQLLVADEYAFNLMQFMEYASDEYILLYLSHHFGGLLLDRIPVINKLKLRSIIFGKTFIGNISAKNNQSHYLFPEGLSGINNPYVELGFGFENILKFVRIDFLWRVTPSLEQHYYFFIKPSVKLAF